MQKEVKNNWFQRNNISFAILLSFLAIISLIIDIFYFQYKTEITFGLVLPLLLGVMGLMGWNTFMSIKHLGFVWENKKLYLHLNYPIFIIIVIIGLGLISYSWSNLFLLISTGVYFTYMSITYNFYKNEIAAYLDERGTSHGKK